MFSETLNRASESPSVVLEMMKKRENNNDDLWAKADMSVVSLTLTDPCVCTIMQPAYMYDR